MAAGNGKTAAAPHMPGAHWLGRQLLVFTIALALAACGMIERGPAVPQPLQDSAMLPGIPNA